MAEDEHVGPRRVGIYVRLCKDFADQAEMKEPDYETTKFLVEMFPWISSHPWSENGIPETFEGQEFSIIRELREEFNIIAKTYNDDLAYSYECAAKDFKRLYHEQYKQDLKYVLEHGTDEQIETLRLAGIEFFSKHFKDEESKYYGTYVPTVGFAFNMILSRFQQEREMFGPRNTPRI